MYLCSETIFVKLMDVLLSFVVCLTVLLHMVFHILIAYNEYIYLNI